MEDYNKNIEINLFKFNEEKNKEIEIFMLDLNKKSGNISPTAKMKKASTTTVKSIGSSKNSKDLSIFGYRKSTFLESNDYDLSVTCTGKNSKTSFTLENDKKIKKISYDGTLTHNHFDLIEEFKKRSLNNPLNFIKFDNFLQKKSWKNDGDSGPKIMIYNQKKEFLLIEKQNDC